MNEVRALMRHTIATVAYRSVRALEGSTDEFATYAGAGRQPGQILAHMGDLYDWALSMAAGKPAWQNSTPRPWAEEQQRFYGALKAFDDYLASAEPVHAELEKLFQGPIADSLTHVGQLAMLRRLAGAAICGENFYVAAVNVGQVSAEQPAAVQPFQK